MRSNQKPPTSPNSRTQRLVGLIAAAFALGALLLVLAITPGAPVPDAATAASAPTLVTALSTGTASATQTVPATASVDAYLGLGTWVDIYDDAVFDRPERAVGYMAAHGVRTIYVETSNSSQRYSIKRPTQMRRLIRAAHARGMKVVAWYLPNLKDPLLDYYRSKQAIRFRTADGQRFDSFALDIESSVVKPVSERNRRLMRVSTGLRRYAGPRYPLGAIIPSPWGMQKNGYWQPFPYQALADTYDVFLPMSYFTYHGEGADSAYADTIANVTILRAQPGCAEEPIHLIGGIASRASGNETRAFVRASKETTVAGVSLYDYPTTRWWHWSALAPWTP